MIEVLVVVAIVALLAGLIFPVFANAKERAVGGKAISMLRQVYVAQAIYDPNGDEPISSIHRPQRAGLLDNSVLKISGDRYELGEGTMTGLCHAQLLRECGGARDDLQAAEGRVSSVISWSDLFGLAYRDGPFIDPLLVEKHGARSLGFYAVFARQPRADTSFGLRNRASGVPFYRVTRDGEILSRRVARSAPASWTKDGGVPLMSLFYDMDVWRIE